MRARPEGAKIVVTYTVWVTVVFLHSNSSEYFHDPWVGVTGSGWRIFLDVGWNTPLVTGWTTPVTPSQIGPVFLRRPCAEGYVKVRNGSW